MKRYLRFVVPIALSLGFSFGTTLALADELAQPNTSQSSAKHPSGDCNLEMTHARYGFQCSGYASTGSNLQPVTLIGTVTGDGRGFFEGYGTFNSSNGSASTHIAGRGTLLPGCFGHVDYTTYEILLPGGGTVPLPPISFDYTAVDGGIELLGTGVASPGATGDAVPRITCRLVRTGE